MPNYTISTHVDAPVEETFRVFSDFRRAPEQVEAIQKLEILTDGPIGEGTRFRETRRIFGREATEEMTITAFRPNESYTVEADSCGTHIAVTFRFEPADGGTCVTIESVMTPVSTVAKLFSPLSKLMSGPMIKCMTQDLEEMKAVAESAASPAGAS